MANSIDVARIDSTVFVRVVGLGSFNNAGPMQEYVDAAVAQGVRDVVVDLDACSGMDSTFMGTLMGFLSCPMTPSNNGQSDEMHVTVLNVHDAAQRALESVGLFALLDVRNQHIDVPECKVKRLIDDVPNPGRRTHLIREAHENLVRIDERNRQTFAPFLKALREECDEA